MILVTGAAGFIGSNLVKQLNKEGHQDILLCDHLRSGDKWQNLIGLNYINHIEPSALLNEIEQYSSELTCIFHLGACSNTLEEDADYLYRNNVKFSQDLFLFAHKNNIRFIYASSAATYGLGENGYDDDHSLLESLKPLNKYGFSKHMFDLWLLRNNYLDQCVGLKYFNIFGQNEYHKENMRSLVLKAYYQITDKGFISLFKSTHHDYKDGEQKRDFLYVDDTVQMTTHFMNNKATGIFNIGSGVANTWNHLAESLFGAIKQTPDIRYIEMPEALVRQYQNYTKANINKLLNSGYSQQISELSTSIATYVNEYITKKDL